MGSNKEEGKFRLWFDQKFNSFQEGVFRKFVVLTFNYRYVTFMVAVGMFVVSIGMMSGGRVLFSFFPTPEADIVMANFKMHSGSTKSQTEKMLENIEKGLKKTSNEFSTSPGLIRFNMSTISGRTLISNGADSGSIGNNILGSMVVELTTADKRNVRTKEFIKVWKQN